MKKPMWIQLVVDFLRMVLQMFVFPRRHPCSPPPSQCSKQKETKRRKGRVLEDIPEDKLV